LTDSLARSQNQQTLDASFDAVSGKFPRLTSRVVRSALGRSPGRMHNMPPAVGIVSGKPMPDWIVPPPIWNFRR
jgi:hypothetical protein